MRAPILIGAVQALAVCLLPLCAVTGQDVTGHIDSANDRVVKGWVRAMAWEHCVSP